MTIMCLEIVTTSFLRHNRSRGLRAASHHFARGCGNTSPLLLPLFPLRTRTLIHYLNATLVTNKKNNTSLLASLFALFFLRIDGLLTDFSTNYHYCHYRCIYILCLFSLFKGLEFPSSCNFFFADSFALLLFITLLSKSIK